MTMRQNSSNSISELLPPQSKVNSVLNSIKSTIRNKRNSDHM